VIIPNSKIGGGNIVNHPAIKTCQIDIPLILNYKDDFIKIEKHILDSMANNPIILKDPAPSVGISKFSESHITYSVKAWTTMDNQNAATGQIMIKIKELFENKTLMLPID
jgi:small conductance mechanosensitive channel